MHEFPKISRRAFEFGSFAAMGVMMASVETASAAARRSRPGVYRGYSSACADGYVRSSEYVTVSDGCRLAVDVYLPTLRGEALEGSRPAVAQFTGYRRAWLKGQYETAIVNRMWPDREVGEFTSVVSAAARMPDQHQAVWPDAARALSPQDLADWVLRNGGTPAEFLLLHGYAVVVADTRATGASFGLATEQNAVQIGQDIADVFEALSARTWSNGEFGMIGASWLGAVQHMALTYGARRLKAVMPQVAPYDQYLGLWPGGLFNLGLMRDWLEVRLSQDQITPAVPVDDDTGGVLRDAALAARVPASPASGGDIEAQVEAQLAAMSALTRDVFYASGPLTGHRFGDGTVGAITQTPLDFVRARMSGIAVYEQSGFWDIYAVEAPVAFANLAAPKKLVIGPWHHANAFMHVEALRWFDHWLRRIDNNVLSEPPVTYSVSSSDGGVEWRSNNAFPDRHLVATPLHLSGSGLLEERLPAQSAIVFDVDFNVSAGPGSRGWGFAQGPRLNYAPIASASSGRLIAQSRPVRREQWLCGFPIFEASVSSSDERGEIFAYLFLVTSDQRAFFLSDGQLDLRFADESAAPHDMLSTPYRAYASTDVRNLTPGAFVRARIAMTPVSWRMNPGDRLALVVTGADRDNFYQPKDQLPRRLTLECGVAGTRLLAPFAAEGGRLIHGAFEVLPDESRAAVEAFAWPHAYPATL